MEIVTKSPNKYCMFDPIPTSLIKECIHEVLLLLTKIINISLQIGDMPKVLKKAIITPLIKKLGIELINKTIDLFLTLLSYQQLLREL